MKDPKSFIALKEAAKALHPKDASARAKVNGVALNRLKNIDLDSFKNATSAQTNDIISDSVVNSIQGVQVRGPSKPSYSKDIRESNRIRVSLRREIFHEALQRGLSTKDANNTAEKILPVVEDVMAKRRQEKYTEIEAEMEKKQQEDDRLTILDKDIMEKIMAKRDNVLYSDENLRKTSQATTTVTLTPEENFPSIFNDSKTRLNIFGKKLIPNNLQFWKQWDDEKARITNLSMGPKNAIEEQILWTEKGRMWPYPVDNEYMLGEEESVSFMDHIFLESYLAKHDLPKTGPVAHFMELVCVGLSKNPYMTVKKKREHLDAFAEYFNPKYVDKVNELHELEQIAAANS